MSAPSATDLFAHMRDAVRQIGEYVEGFAKEDFLGDKRT